MTTDKSELREDRWGARWVWVQRFLDLVSWVLLIWACFMVVGCSQTTKVASPYGSVSFGWGIPWANGSGDGSAIGSGIQTTSTESTPCVGKGGSGR